MVSVSPKINNALENLTGPHTIEALPNPHLVSSSPVLNSEVLCQLPGLDLRGGVGVTVGGVYNG